MSVGSLLSMRPTWLLSKHFYLAGNPKFQPSLAAAGIANTERILWANAQCGVSVDASNTLQADPNAQKAFGFLPWRPSGCTYLELGAGAQLVLTGPLSACTVWAFESGGTTVLVHANDNAGGVWSAMSAAQKLGNLANKQNAVNAVKALYAGPNDVARLTYAATPLAVGARTYEGYMGFVIGCKPRLGFSLNKVSWTASSGSNAWTFYFYGFNGTGAADRVLWPL